MSRITLLIDNKPYCFLIDTGSSVSIIRRNILPSKLEKTNPITLRTATGSVVLNSFQFIPLHGKWIQFYVYNFSHTYEGLLGCDVLQTLNAHIDVARKVLSLDGFQYPMTNNTISQSSYVATKQKLNVHEIETGEEDSRFRLDHLNREERTALMKLLRKFNNIFYKEGDDLTFTHATKHCIKTIHEKPIYCKSYRYPAVHREEVGRQISKMLRQNIICHSTSPYSSPIWVVPKKADASGKDKWRIVVDYRKLNEITVSDRYPIPSMDNILDKLGRCLYFSTIDLAKGFHQIEMDHIDRKKRRFQLQVVISSL